MRAIGRSLGPAFFVLPLLVAASTDCSVIASSSLGLGVGAACENASQCHGGLCESAVCTSACSDDSGCPSPTICIANRCRVGCRADDGCPVAQICESSACVPGCRDNSKCGQDKVCAPRSDGSCTADDVCALECRDPLKVAALFGGTVDGQDTWTTSHKQGLDGAAQRLPYMKNGASVYQYNESLRRADDLARQIDARINEGAKVIVTNAVGLTDEVLRQAPKHPGVSFIVAGGSKNDGVSNAGAYRARSEQLFYVTGKMAARLAPSAAAGRSCIGLILPNASKEVVRETNAFVRGVRAQASGVKVVIRWLGASRDASEAPSYDYTATNYGFSTSTAGKLYREELLSAQLADLGCRVIAQRTDTSRVVSAVERKLKVAVKNGTFKHDLFSIGTNFRESCRSGATTDGEWFPSCMASAYYDWSNVYTKALDQIYRGVWTGAVVAEEFRADADGMMKLEVSPFPNLTTIGAEDAKRAVEQAADAGFDAVFKGPYKFNGQRDLNEDGAADVRQDVGTGEFLSADELGRMCWFVEGTFELPDATVPLDQAAYDGLVPAMVPFGPAVAGAVTTINDADLVSRKKYGDVSDYLKKVGLDPSVEMNCLLK